MHGLVDSSLREGEQMVGVKFSLAEKYEIIKGLLRVGVEEIELGVASELNIELGELVEHSRRSLGAERIALWCRCKEDDIRFAAGLRVDVLSLSIPVSDLHIEKKLAKSRKWVVDTLVYSITLAKQLKIPYVSLGLEDATRADETFLFEVVKQAAAAGVDRVRLADTVGVATPIAVHELVQRVRAVTSCEIGVHMHNDFGMATANCLAALDAGADWADVTILGLGERAGNSRLEEVAGFLALQCGRQYKSQCLRSLSQQVAAMLKREIPPQQPLVGEKIFACESGIHLHGLQCDPATYEPYEPELVGAKRQMHYGAKIGRQGLCARINRLGLHCSKSHLSYLVARFRQQAGRLGRPLTDSELQQLVASQLPM